MNWTHRVRGDISIIFSEYENQRNFEIDSIESYELNKTENFPSILRSEYSKMCYLPKNGKLKMIIYKMLK